jgi:methylase of polypeptide subunit release factors
VQSIKRTAVLGEGTGSAVLRSAEQLAIVAAVNVSPDALRKCKMGSEWSIV